MTICRSAYVVVTFLSSARSQLQRRNQKSYGQCVTGEIGFALTVSSRTESLPDTFLRSSHGTIVCLNSRKNTLKLTYWTVFDNGDLRHTPDKARQMMESLMSAMRQKESPFPKTALVEVHDTVWHRIEKVRRITNFPLFYLLTFCVDIPDR